MWNVKVIVEAERSQVMHIHTYMHTCIHYIHTRTYVHEVEKVVRRSGDAVRRDGQVMQ